MKLLKIINFSAKAIRNNLKICLYYENYWVDEKGKKIKNLKKHKGKKILHRLILEGIVLLKFMKYLNRHNLKAKIPTEPTIYNWVTKKDHSFTKKSSRWRHLNFCLWIWRTFRTNLTHKTGNKKTKKKPKLGCFAFGPTAPLLRRSGYPIISF